MSFKNLKPASKNIEEEAKKIISHFVGIDEGFDVVYRKNDLIIKTNSSVLKNEIFLKKESIQSSLKEKLGEKIFLNIWFK